MGFTGGVLTVFGHLDEDEVEEHLASMDEDEDEDDCDDLVQAPSGYLPGRPWCGLAPSVGAVLRAGATRLGAHGARPSWALRAEAAAL